MSCFFIMDPNGFALNRSHSLASGLEKSSPTWNKPPQSRSSSTVSSTAGENPLDMPTPGLCEGYLLKRRKWPLKGWHKRYFVLEAGILRYSKSQHDVIQGSLDISQAVMSINKKSNRIDLDAGDILYHMKAKNHELFYIWVTKLQAHRLYKKNEAVQVQSGFLQPLSFALDQNPTNGVASPIALTVTDAQKPPSVNTAVNSKVSAWLQQSHAPETCVFSLCQATCFVLIAALATRKYRASISRAPNSVAPKSTGQRTKLPALCPDNSHVGLMAILYNNIGKDLARVSMPAALNEPVNLLQRLCEELEYSELLDTAANTPDPYHRMVYIAAFAISGYSTATFRNRYKPVNPVLGETYECIQEDRGFKLISEQVCHHPPISACHAESDNFCFWQDQRWKNKFWGKSLEIIPTGMVNVTLPKYGDHYEWNKVVTCIHNVFSQQRYLEHYGEVTIQNLSSRVCTCKITFVKSRYWGSETNKNEVQGTVLDESGSVIHRFGGLWHEGIFCDTLPTPKCVWKPSEPSAKDHLLYYGFSSFAMEMNELRPELEPFLPPSDSRLRPDQRMLEDGLVDEADRKKDEIEELQRLRRKELSKKGEEHVPRFFKKTKDQCGRDVWVTKGTYWDLRENPGFASLENVKLW
uniref:Oxysterol-binding protein n=1 Tax=Neogobius melanostomus TaxID=47308 RepID=A0A8C6TT42_9GOBI